MSKDTKHLITYFVVAYALSWAIGVPLALAKQGIIQPVLPEWLHYFVAYGPMLSAAVVTLATEGHEGRRAFWGRLSTWRVHRKWWLVATSPLIAGLMVASLTRTLGYPGVSVADLGEVRFLPPLGMWALFLWVFTFGVGEEAGWRGYALPRLQRRHSALPATIIVTVAWGVWHLPQFFYVFEPSLVAGWTLGLFAGAMVLTWLFNSADGSIPVVAVFHGCFNYISASTVGNGAVAAVVSAMVMIWAVAVVLIYKPRTLSSTGKVVV